MKLLACGDVDGNIKSLYDRVATVNKKNGPFEMLFCVGNFFGPDRTEWEQCKSGQIKVPVPTFILGPTRPELARYYPDLKGCEMCTDVTYLGNRGVYTGASGLSVVYLSGVDGEGGKKDGTFGYQDIKAIEVPLQVDSPAFDGVDVLITSQWPRGVYQYASKPEGLEAGHGSPLVSHLTAKLRPRYHFAGLAGVHYERQPYRNHMILAEAQRHVTRFIALGKVGNELKRKWLYAFNLVPLRDMARSELVKQPPDVTECPYNMAESVAPKEDEAQQFFYDMTPNAGDGRKRRGGGRGGGMDRKRRPPPQPTGPCWFCLASPDVEKQLVVSIGDNAYLALAKGGLTSDHVLILPIGHYQTSVECPDEVREEIDRFKSAVIKSMAKQSKSVVFFERNYRSAHLQIQVVPFPSKLSSQVKDAFMECAGEHDLDLQEIPKHSKLEQVVPPGAPYFYAELPSGEKLLHRVRKGFPLHFGREVMASPSILDLPERIDWKNCQQSKEKEKEATAAFRAVFEPYDFTL